jgi:Protein of unknown function (DUF3341)
MADSHAHDAQLDNASEVFLVGVYDDDETLVDGIKELRTKHVPIDNVYTPFPIHGIDPILGLRESRLPTVAFLAGCVGFLTAVSFQSFMYFIDWQINVGGKPRLPFPSFIPISFEFTVLIASLTMVGTYLVVNKLKPGRKGRVIDPRQTDDLFLITIPKSSEASQNDEARAILKATGAIDVREHTDEPKVHQSANSLLVTR